MRERERESCQTVPGNDKLHQCLKKEKVHIQAHVFTLKAHRNKRQEGSGRCYVSDLL